MTHQKTDLFHRRACGKEFLLYKTDADLSKDLPQALSPAGSDRLYEVFPDILIGKDFIENACDPTQIFSQI